MCGCALAIWMPAVAARCRRRTLIPGATALAAAGRPASPACTPESREHMALELHLPGPGHPHDRGAADQAAAAGPAEERKTMTGPRWRRWLTGPLDSGRSARTSPRSGCTWPPKASQPGQWRATPGKLHRHRHLPDRRPPRPAVRGDRLPAPVPAPLQPHLAGPRRSRTGPDGTQRLGLPADAHPLRRQRPRRPGCAYPADLVSSAASVRAAFSSSGAWPTRSR